jgi:hypothetical protein
LILCEYNTVAKRVYNVKTGLPFDLGIREVGLRVFAYTKCTNCCLYLVYVPPFAYTISFLSPADHSCRRLFSAVFHLPNFLECAGRLRHRWAVFAEAATSQRLSLLFSFIVKSAFLVLVNTHRLNHLEFSRSVHNDVGI